MEFSGNFVDLKEIDGEMVVSFSVNEREALSFIEMLKGKFLKVVADVATEKRTDQQRKYFWECIKVISDYDRINQWDTYLSMLHKHGASTRSYIKKDELPVFKDMWREVIIADEYEEEDGTYLDLICCVGLSKYNRRQTNMLIEDLLFEIESRGLQKPITAEWKVLLG